MTGVQTCALPISLPVPTFGVDKPTLEVHLIDYDGDLYGQTVTVCFDTFMRAEQKFASAELLKEQIDKDTAAAAEYFRTHTIHTDSI